MPVIRSNLRHPAWVARRRLLVSANANPLQSSPGGGLHEGTFPCPGVRRFVGWLQFGFRRARGRTSSTFPAGRIARRSGAIGLRTRGGHQRRPLHIGQQPRLSRRSRVRCRDARHCAPRPHSGPDAKACNNRTCRPASGSSVDTTGPWKSTSGLSPLRMHFLRTRPRKLAG